MKRSLGWAFAAVLAGATSVASAQFGSYGNGLPSSNGLGQSALTVSPYGSAMRGGMGLDYAAPSLLTPSSGSMPGNMGLGYTAPSPLNPREVGPTPSTLSPTAHYPLVNCTQGGCTGLDGTQYARGAGNVMFGSNGKICQYTAPGAPLVCN